ncbi:hypothetical protein ACE6H2_016442 [Prunus campanulata]
MASLIPELDLDQASKTKNSKDPPAPVDPRDLTFADSFLDFESGLRIYQTLIWQKQGRSRLRWGKKSLLERQMAVKGKGKFLMRMSMTQLVVGLNRLPMGLCQLVVWRTLKYQII